MIRRASAILLCVVLLGAVTMGQTHPTTAPGDGDVEIARLRSENAALRRALNHAAAAPANEASPEFRQKYNALRLDRDRAVEQLAIAQQQLVDLQREVEELKMRAAN